MALLVVPGAMLAVGGRPAHLFGVQRLAPQPGLTLAALWSGAFQSQATAWFGQTDPALALAVALRNQAYFSLLHQSAQPDIVVGPGGELVETANIEEYCSREVIGLPPLVEAGAARLAALQDWYAAHGRVFVYVITPSKVSAEPADIPKGWPCHNLPADRLGVLRLWRGALQRHGVRTVDGPAIVAAAPGGATLFPRGGTHWSWVAASLVTQSLVTAINDARPGALTPFTFTWHDAPPEGTDRDLTDLLNLPFPPLGYTAPVVDLVAAAPSVCAPPFIAEIGGSFIFHLDFLLARLPCPPRIALYTYFQLERATFGPFLRGPADPSERRSDLLDTAGIVVLEENEALVFRSHHAEQLWNLFQERLAAR